MTVSEWADANRMLSPESSAEPGRWRTDRAPYQREIMDATTDPEIETVSFMKSAQIGATELINNVIGFHVDQDPAPILLIQPTKETAEAWSRERLDPMLRDTPTLRDKVSDSKSRDKENTMRYKKFPGGFLAIVGANSPSGLAMRPIRIVMFDEVDRFPASAGEEGDPISLGKKRAATFWNHAYIEVSTPTIDGVSRIQKGYNESDQRRFYVSCPHCGERHLLTFFGVDERGEIVVDKNSNGRGGIIWEKDENGNHLPETAAHCCSHCGSLQYDSDLPGMLAKGVWIKGRPEVKGHAGFHINELYSPWVKFSKTVKEFLESKNDPMRLKTWYNTALGEVWREGKDIGKAETLMERRENYDAELVPYGGVFITIGVDVQDDRLEVETIAWGRDHENWTLEYKVLNGDPGIPWTVPGSVWATLDDYLGKTFKHESGARLRVMGTGIDTGGHHTKMVYAFCKERFGRQVFALKGADQKAKDLVTRPSKKNKGKVRLYTVGTVTAKDTIMSQLSQEKPGPGYCHFPRGYGRQYFEQLLAEHPVTRMVRGHNVRNWELKRSNSRNEALDCRVYALATLAILGIDINAGVNNFLQKVGGNPIVDVNLKADAPATRRRARVMSSVA